MIYIKKDGLDLIGIYEGERPEWRDYVNCQSPEFAHYKAVEDWKASLKTYEIKKEFVEEMDELIFQNWLIKLEPKVTDELISVRFRNACETGIPLPEHIASRVEIRVGTITSTGEYPLSYTSGEYAILRPLAVKEEAGKDTNTQLREYYANDDKTNEVVEFAEWIINDPNIGWTYNKQSTRPNYFIYRNTPTPTAQLFEIFKNRK